MLFYAVLKRKTMWETNNKPGPNKQSLLSLLSFLFHTETSKQCQVFQGAFATFMQKIVFLQAAQNKKKIVKEASFFQNSTFSKKKKNSGLNFDDIFSSESAYVSENIVLICMSSFALFTRFNGPKLPLLCVLTSVRLIVVISLHCT